MLVAFLYDVAPKKNCLCCNKFIENLREVLKSLTVYKKNYVKYDEVF